MIFIILLLHVLIPALAVAAGATLLLCWLRPRLPVPVVVLIASLLASVAGIFWIIGFEDVFEAQNCDVASFMSCSDPGSSFASYRLLLSMLVAFAIAWPVSSGIANCWPRR